jgi:hypothetical protein
MAVHVRDCAVCTDWEFCKEALEILHAEFPQIISLPFHPAVAKEEENA